MNKVDTAGRSYLVASLVLVVLLLAGLGWLVNLWTASGWTGLAIAVES